MRKGGGGARFTMILEEVRGGGEGPSIFLLNNCKKALTIILHESSYILHKIFGKKFKELRFLGRKHGCMVAT